MKRNVTGRPPLPDVAVHALLRSQKRPGAAEAIHRRAPCPRCTRTCGGARTRTQKTRKKELEALILGSFGSSHRGAKKRLGYWTPRGHRAVQSRNFNKIRRSEGNLDDCFLRQRLLLSMSLALRRLDVLLVPALCSSYPMASARTPTEKRRKTYKVQAWVSPQIEEGPRYPGPGRGAHGCKPGAP